MREIIDGKLVARGLLDRLRVSVDRLKAEHGIVPHLVVVIVGDDPASKLYVGNKQRKAEELGLQSRTIALEHDTSQEELLRIIDELNRDAAVHGILVQLPLPRHIDKELVINAISPEKDVDGFHNANAGKLATGQLDCMIPCTPQGCIHLIKTVKQNLAGSNAVVIGRSNIVGKPVALLLLYENCTVTVLHSASRNLEEHCLRADIIVAAVGKARFIKASWIKPGAIVVDVGINLVEESGKKRFVGDVEFEGLQDVPCSVTPVPGGVGPMTIAFLLVNTVLGACKQCGVAYGDIKSSLLQ
ncbi:5,10-methylene-tetrahydrofolate dehydrogenase [Anaplasma marginale str. Dawn]|uniref:bifunctional 5,10-methylenetetrahydrofolate dehydrogenase/5,10-methenyltetrahydrofolate cyclohydrolase n=1 Tax=Anaplasma marginale TaxID=770 RepID=UPI0003C286A2|nr:bifunctional methylenetetrahydrofolate dehydrogenase/methenyltetrahydrofolate cyclohydrolase FolD [Anaplasma marginale]AGZ78594.1 5,10-methylene-tetrahydrofolate dehydrogenase [Anaplasma marginale str. Gypsy Plains]AGZ79445.1 5,10-methylene-tetrahydrofolate dehydrogenase [Anaplasma marginale str. Dawn]AXW83792.1 bifunctional 5,10-methylene-tetrahydrofolate dehydrogenase/5,10-methylene-tetrahydrofolate cyclohydrolase [Anaplasma marginale]KAA8472247.1 bifunctional methylenetetrahydrofolate deh